MLALSAIQNFPTKLINPFKSVVLDDGFSRFNRIYLFFICLLAGAFINLADYSGHKVKCHGFQIFPENFADEYCWVQGMYVIKEAFDLPQDIPYPGVVPENLPCLDFLRTDNTAYKCPEGGSKPLTKVKLLWYQWIPLYFFLCAAVFVLPYIIYQQSEIGAIKPICKLLASSMDDDEEEKIKIDRASLWLSKRMTGYIKAKGPIEFLFVKHRMFAEVVFNKVLNLVVVILVLYGTNKIFQVSSFASYGVDWIRYMSSTDNTGVDSPQDKLFPKMASCEVEVWGTTGIVNEAGMCVLAPNVIISYFFLIFWFLLYISLIGNAVSLFFSTSTYFFTAARWRAFVTSTFMVTTNEGKWLFMNSGMSGQITLELLASNIPHHTFENLFKRVCETVVLVQNQEVLDQVYKRKSYKKSEKATFRA
ncbi:innexin inx2-like [Bolinopsis microptera]|uniref:innexin inx2-like n=1 Tax=Bolinopsis microptera TaxID=2820187 RepID=UPI00307AB420